MSSSFLIKENRDRAQELAHTEESINKRKETFKKIKHQQKENNSQFGKRFMWITDGKNNKRAELNTILPSGWKTGKTQRIVV